ncbi:putative ABC transport system ATP-binding protein [Krasilnikovia cinnamomea]|uniref:Putative ABC transport system ATP-binding protein n=1 Tax=Krasilnikovia cinnamomea TaxID=349313 RepID=A0A4Q7ZTY0_9ACTN|nr:ABC transporter ATP-binding protein [Krasilnikovia cinnamomea]RZU54015.1 putative ABC transport system ATP-binding protein [Krasilnikovia cinnamomea]
MRVPTAPDVLRDAVGGQRRLVAAAAVLAAGHQIGEAAVPVLIGWIIDRAMARGGGPATLLGGLALLAVAFAALSLSFKYGLRLGERAAFRSAHLLRMRIAGRLFDDRGARTDRLTGELVNISTDDAQLVGDTNLAWPRAVAAVVGLLAGAAALLSYSVVLGAVVLVAVPVLLAVSHVSGKPLARRAEQGQGQAAAASGLATDLVAGIRTLKGIGAERAAALRYRATSVRSRDAAIRVAAAQSALDGSMIVMTGVLLAVVAALGGHLAATGRISIGDLVAAVGLAQFLIWPLSQFSWVNGQLATGRAGARRVADLLACPPAIHSGTRPAAVVRGALRVHAVTHRKLADLDFTVAAGEFVGVVATPAEAADLLDCLRRRVVPERGGITVDGVPLIELPAPAARRALLVADHHAELFAGTVADNVAAGRAAAGGTGMVAVALAAAQINGLAVGADTVVSPHGASLSGGQRQRVALARAIAADPPVLVLHDPTTAVDAVTETAIAAGLRAARRGRTTLLITTSPALLDTADRVIHLRGGAVARTGAHRDLAAADPGYRAATR